MTHGEILQLLYDETLVGDAPPVRRAVDDGLAGGLAGTRRRRLLRRRVAAVEKAKELIESRRRPVAR